MSARREARRSQVQDRAPSGGVPADLAAGPCVDIWGAHGDDLVGARAAWKSARLAWAQQHGLASHGGNLDWHHMPKELRDRAPFARLATTRSTT